MYLTTKEYNARYRNHPADLCNRTLDIGQLRIAHSNLENDKGTLFMVLSIDGHSMYIDAQVYDDEFDWNFARKYQFDWCCDFTQIVSE